MRAWLCVLACVVMWAAAGCKKDAAPADDGKAKQAEQARAAARQHQLEEAEAYDQRVAEVERQYREEVQRAMDYYSKTMDTLYAGGVSGPAYGKADAREKALYESLKAHAARSYNDRMKEAHDKYHATMPLVVMEVPASQPATQETSAK